MSLKNIDQIALNAGTLRIDGWSQSGPPQSILYRGLPVSSRETIPVERRDVAIHCGQAAASWGFSTAFDFSFDEMDLNALQAIFPDGDVVSAATASRSFVNIVRERVVKVLPELDWPDFGASLRDLSDHVWGEQRFHRGPPSVESHYDAQLVPILDFPDNDPYWGVYRSDGPLIENAAHKRGPGRMLLGQSENIHPRSDFAYVDEVAVYGGLTIPHFGHFLLGGLSRHWKNWKETFPGTKIYMHTMENLETWFSRPHVWQTLTALGYEPADFVPIDRPMRIRHLIVPAPAFIEQCLAHQVFGETGGVIGERLLQGAPPRRRPEPVYLSKERLTGGVWTVENETEFVGPLRAAGIRIVYPETLSLSEQIRIFVEHKTVIGLAGSALHACLFSEGGHRLIGINPTEYLNSNFVILDKVKGNRGTYVNPIEGMSRIDSSNGFTNTFRLSNPQELARDVLRLIG